MILLHAGYVENQFLVWGETPLEIPGDPTRKKKKSTKNSNRLSPYDAGMASLSEMVSSIDGTLDASQWKGRKIFAWLPTYEDKPAASSPLIDEGPSKKTGMAWRFWQVTALELTLENTVRLLCRCIGKELLSPGILIGSDLAFWAAALRFAGSLVARQQYLPDLIQYRETYCSAWKPVIQSDDRETLSKLARAMPAVCRAYSLDGNQEPSGHPLPLLTGFIEILVDYLARSGGSEKLAPAPEKKSAKTRKTSFDSLHDQWIYALRSRDGILRGEEAELQCFFQQVQEWRRSITLSADQRQLKFPPDDN
ncbi:MAG: hypothetical protein AB1656_08140 [Candidatus Omnitrophota bacterium]